MERPSSRGGSSSAFAAGGMSKAPTGSNVPMPDRPSTASRQGPAGPMGGGTLQRGPGQSIMSGAPPGTAMRGGGGGAAGAPPGTAYKRMGTAQGQRPGTGSQGAGSVAVRGGQVQVESRPITNHGLTGIKVSGGGGVGRQVLDKTYFMNELRKKRLEIVNVITSMKTELEALEKKQAQYNTMEARCNDLMKEVKLFQEALADYNTVLDKVGSQTPAYAITQEHAVLKDRNDQQRKRVDDILTERLALEHKTKQAENKILEIQQNMDSRLAGMPPSQRQQYYDLLAEQQALQAESKRFEDAIDALDTQLSASEGELARNPLKQKSLQLQDQLRQLTERKYELQQEEERSKMSPEDQREQLMSKIKRDNAEVDTITSQIREAQDAIKKMESRASSLGGAGALSNAAEEAAKREKFEELLAKERDLQNFMDGFPGLKAAKAAEAQAKQDAIVAALERISKLQQIATSSLPSQKKFKEMQDELEYKKLQLENTQMTQERLKEELQLRRTELDKIDTLEDKIKVELAQLAEKMEQLRKNMDQYNNVADVKQRAEASRERLEYLRGTLLRRKDLLKLTVTERALKHQAKKAQLQENNMAITLDKLEQKLRSLHTAKYTMEDFIKAKESETNYKGLAADVIKISEELNGYIKRAIA